MPTPIFSANRQVWLERPDMAPGQSAFEPGPFVGREHGTGKLLVARSMRGARRARLDGVRFWIVQSCDILGEVLLVGGGADG